MQRLKDWSEADRTPPQQSLTSARVTSWLIATSRGARASNQRSAGAVVVEVVDGVGL